MSRKIIGWWVGVIALSIMAFEAHGAGTPAGTVITSLANIEYTANVDRRSATGAVLRIVVQEFITASLVSQDATAITVSPDDPDVVTTFVLTNNGNGNDSYTLDQNVLIRGDDFDPIADKIFLDENGNGILEPYIDPLYTKTVNDPELAPDESLRFFALFDIPADVLNLYAASAELVVTSKTGTGPAGTILPGLGEMATDAVIALPGMPVMESVGFQVQAAIVLVDKSATYFDPYGGNAPMPGATVRYQFDITVKGRGEANGTLFTDVIPTNTTYSPGTLTLNGFALTDSADTDAGDYGETTPDAVSIDLGDLTDQSPEQTITFDVTID